MTQGLKQIITQLEYQKTAIERALAALREVEGIEAPTPSAPTPGVPVKRKGGKVRNRRSEGQKKRWAAKKVVEEPAPTASAPKPAPRKVRLTLEGRERLAEAMKRRWAVKRAASAVRKAGRKRAAKKAA
jgi:hypothetical protein